MAVDRYSVSTMPVTRARGQTHRVGTFKVPEGLTELQRLRDDSLLLLVVSDLRVSLQRASSRQQCSGGAGERETHSEGEVLSQRVSLESVVGQDTTEIRVASEEDTVHVPCLTLVPAHVHGSANTLRYRGDSSGTHQSAPAKRGTILGTGETSSAYVLILILELCLTLRRW